MMKAWILKTPASVDTRPLLLGDVSTPNMRNDELLVRVSACGICRTDLHVVEGELPVRLSPQRAFLCVRTCKRFLSIRLTKH